MGRTVREEFMVEFRALVEMLRKLTKKCMSMKAGIAKI
jgi:hypothetical protein